MMNIAANAYQVNDSLLAGNNVSSTYTNQPITVALNYGITGNQSEKHSSGYLVNILAQQLAKALANVSAEFYANQSGKYFSGQSAKHFANLKRGEFTSFVKGDFSHLMQDLSNITTQGIIEFCQSIKKGSNSATRFNQLFGLVLNRSSSLRQAVLTHELNEVSPITESICSNKSSSNRIVLLVLLERSYGFLSFSSCIGSNHYDSLCVYGANQYKGKRYKKTMPRSASTLTGHLITSDNEAIEVTMKQHNTPVIGRNSLTPNTSFKWLFLALERNNLAAKPCRIETTAPNEHAARLMLVRDYILLFAGRVPVQEVAA